MGPFKAIIGLIGNRCPVCYRGSVFRGIFTMNTACSHCGLVFEKEPGFFVGASVIAYFVGGASLIPMLVITFLILNWELWMVLVFGIIQMTVLTPFLYRYSRLSWLYLEKKMSRSLED
jgi:uncharacterized protein (DUF983 family)